MLMVWCDSGGGHDDDDGCDDDDGGDGYGDGNASG